MSGDEQVVAWDRGPLKDKWQCVTGPVTRGKGQSEKEQTTVTVPVAGEQGQGKIRWQAMTGLDSGGNGPQNYRSEDEGKAVAGLSKLKYSHPTVSGASTSRHPVSRSAYSSISDETLAKGLYDMVNAVRLFYIPESALGL